MNLGSLNEPIEFDSDFSLYNGDISDSTDFMLQAYNDVLVDTAIQQSFTISRGLRRKSAYITLLVSAPPQYRISGGK